MHRFNFLLLGVALAFLVSSCSKDPNSPSFVVAKGNGVKVTRKDLNEAELSFLKMRGMSLDRIPKDQIPAFEKQFLQEFVSRQLLERKAESVVIPDLDKKIDEQIVQIKKQAGERFDTELKNMGKTEADMKKELRTQAKVSQFMQEKFAKSSTPTEDELKAFYEQNKPSFIIPPIVRASHVLIKIPKGATSADKAAAKKKIDAAYARVNKGEEFAKVAREVSEDPGSSTNGGDLNFFQKGRMVPEFDKVAFATKAGSLSPVFETIYGFHFLKVTEAKSGQLSYEDAKADIGAIMTRKSREEEMNKFIKQLVDEAKVKYHLPETASVDTKKTVK
ncbi:MAG: peptidylprolyl isomerase [Verrucomicrobiota bacterium]|nr:peptidylprolyl isomerase [Verrucomicrobiota bacterium]